MVMDRPTLGGPGGARAEVGAVSQTVADRLAASREVRPSVWLERGGRLRCVASTGEGPVRDGISPTAGVIGATFTSGVESVVPDAAAAHRGATSRPRLVAQACVPIRAEGLVVGVLDAKCSRQLCAGDLERLRDAADELGRAVAEGGGPPAAAPAGGVPGAAHAAPHDDAVLARRARRDRARPPAGRARRDAARLGGPRPA